MRIKSTKRALEDCRIATAKIDLALNRLNDLKRTEPRERDMEVAAVTQTRFFVAVDVLLGN